MKSGTPRWSRRLFASAALIVVALPACSSGSGEPAERATAGSSFSTLSPASSGTITTGVPGGAASAVPGTPATVASPGRGSNTHVSETTPTGTVAAAPADPGCPGIRCVSIVLSGDVLVHPPLVDQARTDGAPAPGLDFGPILAAQERFVAAADLAVCHLETPVAPPDGPFEGYPLFSVPPQVLTGLTVAGYDACTTASNHTLDQGPAGLARTLDALDAAGLAHTGSYRSAQEAENPTVLDAAGARVTVISATYGLNTGPPDPSWQVDLVDTDRIRRDAARAAEMGADLVIVALHDGTEYQAEPTAQQRRHAEELLADPAVDLVYGHHAHVVQPLQRLNGKWVAYGLGNMIAAHETPVPETREGLLLRVTFSLNQAGGWSTSDIAWVASFQPLEPPHRWCALTSTSACSGSTTVDAEVLARTTATVNLYRADVDGAHPLTEP